MDRLTKRLGVMSAVYVGEHSVYPDTGMVPAELNMPQEYPFGNMAVRDILVRLADYEDLGTVAELSGYKSFYEAMRTLPGCNTCADKAGCPVKTRPGEYERINCHLWRKKPDSMERVTT